ncbi:hypothetical protein [Nostoc flagelliforme]|uniref:hypothetical protein n=1 Tax=Nostoc flagelliforme TaxID=1306274 RepID=UPI0012FDE6BF|nr:hypothetical protein [Nostoc flagelliforme]
MARSLLYKGLFLSILSKIQVRFLYIVERAFPANCPNGFGHCYKYKSEKKVQIKAESPRMSPGAWDNFGCDACGYLIAICDRLQWAARCLRRAGTPSQSAVNAL